MCLLILLDGQPASTQDLLRKVVHPSLLGPLSGYEVTVEGSFELTAILLSQPPGCRDYRCAPPCPFKLWFLGPELSLTQLSLSVSGHSLLVHPRFCYIYWSIFICLPGVAPVGHHGDISAGRQKNLLYVGW